MQELLFALLVIFALGILSFVDWVRRRHPRWRNVLALIIGGFAAFYSGFALYLYGIACSAGSKFQNFIVPICLWTFLAFTLHVFAYMASSTTRVLALPYVLSAVVLLGAAKTRGFSALWCLPLLLLGVAMYISKQRQHDEIAMLFRERSFWKTGN